jgi:hypothetical protein
MVAMPALAAAPVGAGALAPVPRAAVDPDAPALSSWLKAAVSSVGLAPITMDRMPIGMRRGSAPSPLDDAEDSKPYSLVKLSRQEERKQGGGNGAAGAVVRTWKRELGLASRIFRWLNESAYFVSIPFVLGLLVAIAMRSRSLSLLAATVVVALNVGRIVAGLGNLIFVPLRDGLNTKKLKKPLRRVIEPVVTMTANDNWVELTLRYIVDYRKRRSTKDALFSRILDAIEASEGRVSMASMTIALVQAPKLDVRLADNPAQTGLAHRGDLSSKP